MSLDIWHQLDHPKHPLAESDKLSVIEGARVGSMAVRSMDGEPWLDVMEDLYAASGAPDNGREFFIGEAIGVRAALNNLGVQAEDYPGFNFSGAEMINIRSAVARGSNQGANYDSSSAQTYSALVRQMQNGSLAPAEPATFIGYSIGIRYADLSHSQSSERMVA